MIYRVIGIMSGSSLDGLDMVMTELEEQAGKWNSSISHAHCEPYSSTWKAALQGANSLSALDYQLLHTAYGHYIGESVNAFILKHQLAFQVQLIASHGHTCFHMPSKKMTAQLGDGAAIAAETGLPVVTELRSMDLALGGQGAPIVPIGEKLLFEDYDLFLNLGGIANLSRSGSHSTGGDWLAFDICPANRILNMLAAHEGQAFDAEGGMASAGKLSTVALNALNSLAYYGEPYPKSLSNDFGTDIVYPLIMQSKLSTADALRTYVEHIALQVRNAVQMAMGTGWQGTQGPLASTNPVSTPGKLKLLATGGGALNTFLISQLRSVLADINVEVFVPEKLIVEFKEAMIMALIGVLRWRDENNTMASVTGASRSSINGAVWMGTAW